MDPLTYLRNALENEEYLADLSFIFHLDEAGEIRDDFPILRVPDCIDHLFREESAESSLLLAAMIRMMRDDTRELNAAALDNLVGTIRFQYLALSERNIIRPIADETDPEISEIMFDLIPDDFEQSHDGRMLVTGSLFSRAKQRVRQSLNTTLSFSKRTGMGILMRGQKTLDILSERIAQLNLPSRHQQFLNGKAKLQAKLLNFKGGKPIKIYVGVGLAAAGLFTGSLLVGIPGLALAVMDP